MDENKSNEQQDVPAQTTDTNTPDLPAPQEPETNTSLKGKVASFKASSLKDKLLGNKKLLAICASVLLLVLASGAYALTRPDNDSKVTNETKRESAKISASVSYVEGSVELKNGEAYTAVTVDTALEEGATLRTTGATSRATISLGNGNIVRLNGDTEIVLTALREDEVVIMQENGQIYSRVSPASDALYTVETNTGTYTALGTAFKTTSGGDEESVEVYDSKVEEGTSQKTVNQGEKLYLKNVQDTAKENKVEPLDIEVVKSDPFVSWCRTEDEKIDAFKDKLGFLSDVTAPSLTLSSPADKSTVNVDSDATKGSVSFKGKTDPGAKVTIQSLSVSGSTPVEVTVGADGGFESSAIDGIIGASKFEVVARDAAGNKTKQTITVTFKKPASATSPISLSYGGLIDGKYQISWTTSSSFVDADGFKVVWNTSGDPTYPTSGENKGAEFVAADERTAGITSFEKSTTSDLKYYVRVCRYTDGGCDNYSNTVTITVPKKTT